MADVLKKGKRRYAFVPPRFAESIGGGAETLVAELASRLAARGDEIEVFTTCARDNRSWDNFFPPGEDRQYGVKVTRFPVDARNLDIWIPLQIRISEGLRLTVDEQLLWLKEGVNSAALYAALAKRAGEFDAVFFAPYLFATTFFGSLICPDNSILIPCLHDESYAYTDVMGSMFRQVAGCVFNARPEMELANRLYGQIKGNEAGMGFELSSAKEVSSLTPFFAEKFPYLLYVGRKETGKNVQTLIDHFIALKETGELAELRLVIAGGGSFSDLHRNSAIEREDIIDLAQLSELDKRRLIRHAALLCQPSNNESFSIVIMEAWLLGCPVIVSASCPVTREHVIDSGGGLYFRDAADFCLAVKELVENVELRENLSAAGYEYVKRRYNWGAVLERFDAAVSEILDIGSRAQSDPG